MSYSLQQNRLIGIKDENLKQFLINVDKALYAISSSITPDGTTPTNLNPPVLISGSIAVALLQLVQNGSGPALDVTGNAIFRSGITIPAFSLIINGSGNVQIGTGVFIQNGNVGFSGTLAAAIAGSYNVYGGIVAP